MVMCSWSGQSSVVSFEVSSIVRVCGNIWGRVGIAKVSNRESVGVDSVSVGLAGWGRGC